MGFEYIGNGAAHWFEDGKMAYHRIDGPIIMEECKSDWVWMINGKELNNKSVRKWHKELGLKPSWKLTEEQSMLFKLKFG